MRSSTIVATLLAIVGVGGLVAYAGRNPEPGETVRSGSLVAEDGIAYEWRVKYTLNEKTPYVAQVKLSGFGGDEDGWEFVDVAETVDDAEALASAYVAQLGDG